MRCPDCNKFVGMENGDAEVDSVDLDDSSVAENGEVVISASVSLTRNCAECSTELKRWSGETNEVQASVPEAHRGTGHDLAVDGDDPEVDESGGGRYAKNYITATIPFVVSCSCGEAEVLKGELKAEAAAGEFEESV